MEKIVKLDSENIEEEHICCGFSDKKCKDGYQLKKNWLKSNFREGYVFKKLDVRGKVFIEYVPAEKAWAPIDAPNYMFIDCFWVSGQFKGKGSGKSLLQECINDSKDKDGIVLITSDKKRPFLNDKKFFKMQGFELCDRAEPYFELWYKPLKENAPKPRFKDCVRKGECDNKEGLTLYYSAGCPFTEYYSADIDVVAAEKGFKIKLERIDTLEKAQNHFSPFTKYSVFNDGKFVTHHILNEKSFDKFVK